MWNKGENNILKFGSFSLATVGAHSVWSRMGVYPWPTLGSVALVSSTSGATDAGVHITVAGLNTTTWERQEEEVMLDASGIATSSLSFIRVSRAWNSNSVQAAGTIEISVSGTVVAEIKPVANQTQMAIFTVPAGCFGYILRANYSAGNKDEVNFGLRTREFGQVFRLRDNLFGLTANSVCRIFESGGRPQSGIYVPEKTDIEIRTDVLTVNARVSGTFAIPLFKAR